MSKGIKNTTKALELIISLVNAFIDTKKITLRRVIFILSIRLLKIVKVLKGKNIEERQVEVGLEGSDFIEIISGLSEGEKVIID